MGFKEQLSKYTYKYFIISLDLSKELLIKLYQAKGYDESLKRLDTLLQDHEKFLERFSDDVGFSISDDQFLNRLELSLKNVDDWIKGL